MLDCWTRLVTWRNGREEYSYFQGHLSSLVSLSLLLCMCGSTSVSGVESPNVSLTDRQGVPTPSMNRVIIPNCS
ncbi:MAG: hypothetical protein J07HX5_01662 [halophilic archaeon J07HX5]|nr:MAG: hypothetical protein J07HX5_01662 [halophilic archaeon J07HX5]